MLLKIFILVILSLFYKGNGNFVFFLFEGDRVPCRKAKTGTCKCKSLGKTAPASN